MLSVEIHPDGGLTIEATERELRDLASYLLRAALRGETEPAFVTEQGATSIRVLRTDLGDE
jgi:hypothetical protein